MKQGWTLVKMSDIAAVKGGKRVPKGKKLSETPTSHPYIRVADFQDNGTVNKEDVLYVSDDVYATIKRYTISSNDVYLSIAGTIGKSGIIPQSLEGANLTENACKLVLKDVVYNRFMYYVTLSPQFKKQVKALTKTSTQPKLAIGRVEQIEIPLPENIDVQYDIVRKLDSDFAKIDRIKLNAKENLSETKALFQSILSKGIIGDIYNDINNDSGSLLHDLRECKTSLESERLIPKKAPIKPLNSSDSVPFSIPKNWEWCKLSEVSLIQEGAGIRKFQYRDSGVQLLTVTNIIDGVEAFVDLERQQIFIDESEYESKYKQLTLRKGDIVCACSGGSWGKSAIFDLDDTMILNTSTLRLRFFGDLGYNKYLYFLTKSRFFKSQIEKQLTGMQPNFGYSHYSKVLIPLPPYSVQVKLANIWDKLYQKISIMQSNYDQITLECDALKEALLRKAFNDEL